MATFNVCAGIYLLWGVVVLGLCVARLARAAFKAGCGGMISPIAKALRYLMCWGGTPVSGAAQPIDKLVKSIGDEQLVERVSRGLTMMHPVSAFSVAFQLLSWGLEYGYDLQSDSYNSAFELFASSRLITLYFFTLTVLAVYFPAGNTLLLCHLQHLLATICCVVALALQFSMLEFFHASVWVIITRTAFGIVHGDTRATIVNNSIFTLAILVTFHLRWGLNAEYFLLNLLPSAFICVISALVQQSRESELRATLDAKASKELETSVEAVLSTICDA
ncbi:unnamed protein product, partial [Polarella glacialis]